MFLCWAPPLLPRPLFSWAIGPAQKIPPFLFSYLAISENWALETMFPCPVFFFQSSFYSYKVWEPSMVLILRQLASFISNFLKNLASFLLCDFSKLQLPTVEPTVLCQTKSSYLLLFFDFFLVLLRNNWHISLYKFKMYSVMV